MRHVFVLGIMVFLTACGDYVPREKMADADMETGAAIPPYPCPDWSHSAVVNYDNSRHSNYGCAVNNNLAVQLVDPMDLKRGRGSSAGDTEMTVRTMELYRAGEIPAVLEPMQADATSQ